MPFDGNGNYHRFPASENKRGGYSNDSMGENAAVNWLVDDYGNPTPTRRRIRNVDNIRLHGDKKSLEPMLPKHEEFMKGLYPGAKKPTLILEFTQVGREYHSKPLGDAVAIRLQPVRGSNLWRASIAGVPAVSFHEITDRNMFKAVKRICSQRRWFYYAPAAEWVSLDFVYRFVWLDFGYKQDKPQGECVYTLASQHLPGRWFFEPLKSVENPVPEYRGGASRINERIEEPEPLPKRNLPPGCYFEDGMIKYRKVSE